MQKGFIHIYTGDGKGKTTAAVGITVRAVGNGLKVLFIQFIKAPPTGEIEILKKFPEMIDIYIDIYRCSTSFIYGKPDKNQKGTIKSCIAEIKEKILKNKYDLIVRDEFCNAINLGLISKKETEKVSKILKEYTERYDLKPELIYSSYLKRAFSTAEIIGKNLSLAEE